MPHEKPSPLEMQEHFNAVSTGLILELKSPPHTDLTRSNLCHELTRYIARRLQAEGSPTQRELHADKCGNWHFVLNHEGPGKPPSDDDLITDFNPWQWGGSGTGILHLPRGEVIKTLSRNKAPNFFVALRGLSTIVERNTDRPNPYRHQNS